MLSSLTSLTEIEFLIPQKWKKKKHRKYVNYVNKEVAQLYGRENKEKSLLIYDEEREREIMICILLCCLYDLNNFMTICWRQSSLCFVFRRKNLINVFKKIQWIIYITRANFIHIVNKLMKFTKYYSIYLLKHWVGATN